MDRQTFWVWAAIAVASFEARPSSAFEHTKVLPKGVRGLAVRFFSTSIGEKTDRRGDTVSLAEPLHRDLTFAKVAETRQGIERVKVKAYLGSHGFTDEQAVGRYTADLRADVSVVAPIISYGISDRLTFALAVPYFRASTDIAVGFKRYADGERFVDSLTRPENNLTSYAREAGEKMNHAVGELNLKLDDHGYEKLGQWQRAGLGDVTLAGKYLAFDNGYLQSAVTTGFVAPTGRVDHPDILTDIPFGDGQWDLFTQVAFDQPVARSGVFFNQYATYTAQIAGRRTVRLATAAEPIEVERARVDFDLGDKIDAGASVQYQPSFGLIAGAGYVFFRKFADRFSADAAVRRELEKESDQTGHFGELQLGYNGIPAFQRGQMDVPLQVTLGYRRMVASRNMPVGDLAQFDVNVFF